MVRQGDILAYRRAQRFEAQGVEKRGRTPFGRIHEWLDIAEQFVFDDHEVGYVCAGP